MLRRRRPRARMGRGVARAAPGRSCCSPPAVDPSRSGEEILPWASTPSLARGRSRRRIRTRRLIRGLRPARAPRPPRRLLPLRRPAPTPHRTPHRTPRPTPRRPRNLRPRPPRIPRRPRILRRPRRRLRPDRRVHPDRHPQPGRRRQGQLVTAALRGAGRIRTRDTRVKSPLGAHGCYLGECTEGRLTCAFAYSVQLIPSRHFAVSRRTVAGQTRDRHPRRWPVVERSCLDLRSKAKSPQDAGVS